MESVFEHRQAGSRACTSGSVDHVLSWTCAGHWGPGDEGHTLPPLERPTVQWGGSPVLDTRSEVCHVLLGSLGSWETHLSVLVMTLARESWESGQVGLT